jgi:hypothetical protein
VLTVNRLTCLTLTVIVIPLLFVPICADCQMVVCSRTMPERTCDRFAIPIENELQRLGAPSGWKWVVLDAKDWRHASRMFEAAGQTGTAFTVRDLNTVFLNGEYLQTLRPQLPTRTLAHELGHIVCRCGSEMVANEVASELLAGYIGDTQTARAKPAAPTRTGD